MIQAIRGTYDVLPADVGIWHAVETRLRQTFHRYGFGGDAAFDRSTLLAWRLREAGKRTYLDFDARSLKSQMRLADKLGAKSVVIIGEEELKSGNVVVRDMSTKEQRAVAEEELV